MVQARSRSLVCVCGGGGEEFNGQGVFPEFGVCVGRGGGGVQWSRRVPRVWCVCVCGEGGGSMVQACS